MLSLPHLSLPRAGRFRCGLSCARALLLSLLTFGTACRDPSDVLCAPLKHLAVEADVVDVATGSSLVEVATGTVMASGRTEPMHRRQPDSKLVLQGGTTVGVAKVTIQAPGYVPFDTSGLVIRSTGTVCKGFVTVFLVARLRSAT